jgi:hypothetical protein
MPWDVLKILLSIVSSDLDVQKYLVLTLEFSKQPAR